MSWGHYYSLWSQELHLPICRNLHSLTADWQGAGEREKVLKDWEEEKWLQRCIRETGFWQGAMCNSAQKCPWQCLEWTHQKSPPCVLTAQFSAQQVAKPGPWRREVDSSGNEKCLWGRKRHTCIVKKKRLRTVFYHIKNQSHMQDANTCIQKKWMLHK